MFGADGQADGVWPDALVQQFFRRVLRVRGGCRMDNQRFDIGHIGQQREKFQMINPIPGVTLVSLQIESEDRSAVVDNTSYTAPAVSDPWKRQDD